MKEPARLSELRGESGPLARAGRDLGALVRARRQFSSPRDSHAAAYWALRHRLCSQSKRRRGIGVLWAVGLAGAGALGLIAFHLLPRNSAPVPVVEVTALRPDEGLAEVTPEPVEAPADLGPGTKDQAHLGLGHSAGQSARSPSPMWSRLELGDLGTIELSPSAGVEIVELDAERQVRIRDGILRAEILRQDPGRPVVVVTPHLRVIVVGTRLDVRTDLAGTEVDLLQGAVRVESASRSIMLGAGESISSDDARLQAPPAPAPRAFAPKPVAARRVERPSLAQCASQSAAQARVQCLERIARGNGLAAQSALVNLAMVEGEEPESLTRSLERLREYEARFPDGALAAEAAMRALEILLELGRTEEIIAAATAFQRRFPDDPRVAEAALAQASALCATPAGRQEAGGILRALELESREAIREAASALRERCGATPPPDGRERAGPVYPARLGRWPPAD